MRFTVAAECDLHVQKAVKYSNLWIVLSPHDDRSAANRTAKLLADYLSTKYKTISAIGLQTAFVSHTQSTIVLLYIQCRRHREITDNAIARSISATKMQGLVASYGLIPAIPRYPVDFDLFGEVEQRVPGSIQTGCGASDDDDDMDKGIDSDDLGALKPAQLRALVVKLRHHNENLQSEVASLKKRKAMHERCYWEREYEMLPDRGPCENDSDELRHWRYVVLHGFWESREGFEYPAQLEVGSEQFCYLQGLDAECRALLRQHTPRDAAAWCMGDMLKSIESMHLYPRVPYYFRGFDADTEPMPESLQQSFARWGDPLDW